MAYRLFLFFALFIITSTSVARDITYQPYLSTGFVFPDDKNFEPELVISVQGEPIEEIQDNSTVDLNMNTGFHLATGFKAEYSISEFLKISGGAGIAYKTFSDKLDAVVIPELNLLRFEMDGRYHLYNIDFPIHVRRFLTPLFFVEAGIQPSVNLYKYASISGEGSVNRQALEFYFDEDEFPIPDSESLIYEEDHSTGDIDFELSINAGAGYKHFSGLEVAVLFEWGPIPTGVIDPEEMTKLDIEEIFEMENDDVDAEINLTGNDDRDVFHNRLTMRIGYSF